MSIFYWLTKSFHTCKLSGFSRVSLVFSFFLLPYSRFCKSPIFSFFKFLQSYRIPTGLIKSFQWDPQTWIYGIFLYIHTCPAGGSVHQAASVFLSSSFSNDGHREKWVTKLVRRQQKRKHKICVNIWILGRLFPIPDKKQVCMHLEKWCY